MALHHMKTYGDGPILPFTFAWMRVWQGVMPDDSAPLGRLHGVESPQESLSATSAVGRGQGLPDPIRTCHGGVPLDVKEVRVF